MPNRITNTESSHSFEVVTSGVTWVKARGLKDGNPFTQRVIQHATHVRLHYSAVHGFWAVELLNDRLGASP